MSITTTTTTYEVPIGRKVHMMHNSTTDISVADGFYHST